jgi:hypothetical protein
MTSSNAECKKKSNAWAHAMTRVGGLEEDPSSSLNSSRKGKEMNQLLGKKSEAPKNLETSAFVSKANELEHDISYSSWNNEEFDAYVSEEKTDHYGPSSYSHVTDNSRPIPPAPAAARMGESDCFSSLQKAFDLHQTLATLRKSHVKLENGQPAPVQPQVRDCAGSFSDIIYQSYSKAIGLYKDPYYGKTIDHSKLRQMAASSVRAEMQGLDPNHSLVEEGDEEETFLSVYGEFPCQQTDESKFDII